MQDIKNFKIEDVPSYKVKFAATIEDDDYEEERIYVIEDCPNHSSFTIAVGEHCSCFGFDDTEWDATVYDKEEFIKVISGWLNYGSKLEKIIAQIWKEVGYESDI